MTTRPTHRLTLAVLTLVLAAIAVGAVAFLMSPSPLTDAAAATTPSKKTTTKKVAPPVTTAIAEFAKGAKLSARGRTVAVAVQTSSTAAELRVSTGTAVPVKAVGAGPLPAWAQPHVGTDATGSTVITYPRCSTEYVVSCDIYVWSSKLKKSIKLAAISDPKRGESEGVMERGNIAIVREKSGILATLESVAIGKEPYRTDIFYKPTTGNLKRVTSSGGRNIALSGDWIADLRDTTPSGSDDHECGVASVGLLTVSGTRRDVRDITCGDAGRQPAGPAFSGNTLLFGEALLDGKAMAYRYSLASKITTKAAIRLHAEAWAPVNAGTGYALGTSTNAVRCGEEAEEEEEETDENGDPIVSTTPPAAAPTCKLSRVTGLVMASPTLPKKTTTTKSTSKD